MKKIIKIIVLFLLVLIGVSVVFLCYKFFKLAVPKNYTEEIATGGKIEKTYLSNGAFEVAYLEEKTLQSFKKYEIWYPKVLETEIKQYLVIVVNNGTGIKASKAKSLFEHFASWGFIVIGTEEEFSWNGFSADMSLNYLLKANENKESIFYQKIDTNNIATVGHSQGGVGSAVAATDSKHKQYYKTVVMESPTSLTLAKSLDWNYEVSSLNVPTLLIAGTGKVDQELVIPYDELVKLYEQMEQSPLKVMARRTGYDHGEMLYVGDGYVTAWLMWHLQNDQEAAQAFIGKDAELLQNSLWQDQKLNRIDS